jgi:UDP-GlcNAc3NAcA epimerase
VPSELNTEPGQSHRKIQVVGDIMLDTLRMFQHVLNTEQNDTTEVPESYILLTLHRNFNTDDPVRLSNIFKGLTNLASALNVSVIFPVHPRTSNALREAAIAIPEQIKLLSPQGYIQTQQLIRNSGLVITDSGGLQKEAFFHGKHGLILRDTTEWKNLLKHSYSVCVDDNPIAIETEGSRLFGKTIHSPAPLFGDGTTAKQILAFLEEDLS